MKKAIPVLLLLSVLPMLFSSTKTSVINSGNTMTIKGFYEASDDNIMQFMVTTPDDGSNTPEQVLHAGILTTTQNAEVSTPVFDWIMEGNYNGTITLTFKFSPLQGYKNETHMYYIPDHVFVMSINPTVFLDTDGTEYSPQPATRTDSFYTGNTSNKSAVFDVKTHGNYPYPDLITEENDVQTVTPVTKEITLTYSGSVSDSAYPQGGFTGSWRRTGRCSLTIVSYEAVQGLIQYASTVQVEVSST